MAIYIWSLYRGDNYRVNKFHLIKIDLKWNRKMIKKCLSFLEVLFFPSTP